MAGADEPAFTKRYWDTSFTTDWAVGSPMTWDNHGIVVSDPGQVVLESDPFRRLSYTWCSFTPEMGERFGLDAEFQAELAGEPRSTVTFDIDGRRGRGQADRSARRLRPWEQAAGDGLRRLA